MKRLLLVAAAALGLAPVSAGLGEKLPQPDAASRLLARQIQSRLTAAGYAIEGMPLVVSVVPIRGGSVTHLGPRPVSVGSPAFRVEVDYASRHSFSVLVSVQASAAAAAARLTHVVMDCTATHCNLSQAAYSGTERRLAVGRVVYDAISDDGKAVVPLRDFKRFVALAAG